MDPLFPRASYNTFKILKMVGNIPGRNYLGENVPWGNTPLESLMGGNFPDGSFSVGNLPRAKNLNQIKNYILR